MNVIMMNARARKKRSKPRRPLNRITNSIDNKKQNKTITRRNETAKRKTKKKMRNGSIDETHASIGGHWLAVIDCSAFATYYVILFSVFERLSDFSSFERTGCVTQTTSAAHYDDHYANERYSQLWKHFCFGIQFEYLFGIPKGRAMRYINVVVATCFSLRPPRPAYDGCEHMILQFQ